MNADSAQLTMDMKRSDEEFPCQLHQQQKVRDIRYCNVLVPEALGKELRKSLSAKDSYNYL